MASLDLPLQSPTKAEFLHLVLDSFLSIPHSISLTMFIENFTAVGGVSRESKDGLLWYKDIRRYGSGSFGIFVGVYDGHGGPEASRYVCDHLCRHFQGSFFYLFSN